MKKFLSMFTAVVSLVCFNACAADNVAVRRLVEQGVAGDFNCAFKGKTASKKCHVTNAEEVVTNKDLVAFYGAGGKAKSVKMQVLNILWPDNTRSRFAWGDSMEISNLEVKDSNGFALKFAEWPEIDYKKGLIILDDQKREFIRLW